MSVCPTRGLLLLAISNRNDRTLVLLKAVVSGRDFLLVNNCGIRYRFVWQLL